MFRALAFVQFRNQCKFLTHIWNTLSVRCIQRQNHEFKVLQIFINYICSKSCCRHKCTILRPRCMRMCHVLVDGCGDICGLWQPCYWHQLQLGLCLYRFPAPPLGKGFIAWNQLHSSIMIHIHWHYSVYLLMATSWFYHWYYS